MLLVQFLSARPLARLRGKDRGYLSLPALKIDIEHGGGVGEKSHMLVAISLKRDLQLCDSSHHRSKSFKDCSFFNLQFPHSLFAYLLPGWAAFSLLARRCEIFSLRFIYESLDYAEAKKKGL